MKCAIITPIPLLETYAVLSDNYHLILGHILTKEPQYMEFYKARAAEGDFVILDNSAHEFGVGSNIDGLINLAIEVGASEIVLPDRLFFGDDTLYYAQQAYYKVRREIPYISIMGVPQGRTLAEYSECLQGLVELGVDTIGISKDYEVWPGGLKSIVGLILMMYPDIQIHLLGWGRDLTELYKIGKLFKGRIRGVDSAKPLQYADCMTEIPSDPGQVMPEYPRRDLNFFHLDYSDIPMGIALMNIQTFKKWAKG